MWTYSFIHAFLPFHTVTRPTHHTLQSADIFQFNLCVLQLLGESCLDALCLQASRFAFLQLIGDMESE